MKVDTLATAALGAVTIFSLPLGAAAQTAFRAADAIVVVNKATVKDWVDPYPKGWYRSAAIDLTNVIAKVTGHAPMIYEEGDARAARRAAPTVGSQPASDSLPVIYLGETAAAKAAGITGEGLRNGDWRIKTEPGRAFLFAKTAMGAAYAVNDFVSRYLGYDFILMDGNDPYDFNPDVTVPVADVTVRPAIYGRCIYTGMMDANKWPKTKRIREAWQRHISGDTTEEIEGRHRIAPGPGGCHTIFNYLPPEKFFKDHPEWYSMNDRGQRKGVRNAQSQICYTNPEAKEEVYRALVRFVEEEYARSPKNPSLIFDMTQMDNSDFLCLCPECKKVIAKYNRREGGHGEGGDAGLQLEFVNDLARRIRVKYPGVQLRVFAYCSSETAPKPGTIGVEPNVVVWWCDVFSRSDHTLPLNTSGHYNMAQVEELNGWLALTHNIHIWDYLRDYNSFPTLSVDAIASDAKYFARTGIPRLFMETEYAEQAFYELNCFLESRLYVDPDQDVDALVRRFCRIYGKGAADMEEAISFLRKIEREQPATNKGDWHFRILPWLTRGNMYRLAELFRRAYDREPDVACRSRILGPLMSTWKELVSILKKDLGAKDALKVAMENYRRYAKEWYATGFFEERDRAKFQAAVDDELEVLTLKFDDVPEAVKGAPDSDIVCIDYHMNCDRRKDPLSSRGQLMSRTPKGANEKFPIACGLYDIQAKDHSLQAYITKDMLPADGKYHWVNVGKGHIGRNTSFWFPATWQAGVGLKDYHILDDGMAVDPNWYDVWVSMRVAGPNFIPGSTDENMIALDRILLRRIAPPKKGK